MKSLTILEGDITESSLDAIVNAGNTELWLGTGVAGAIRERGGPNIQKELNLLKRFNARPVELAEVVVTHPGVLPCKFILHAAVMHSTGVDRGRTTASIIYASTRNSLLALRSLGMRSISFPLFGTGVGGMDYADSAYYMKRAMEYYGHGLDVIVYCYGDEALKATTKVFNQ